jgi:outer membrane protein assembly factor BamB
MTLAGPSARGPRAPRWRAALLGRGAALGLALLAVASVRCRTPTALRVTTLSEVDCAKRARVAIVVAHDVPSLQGVVPSAFSTTCVPASAGNNDTGSVVLAPAGADDDPVAFAVMTRPDGESPETCLDPAHAGQCIVARRQLRFAPHVQLDVPIELRLSCLGVSCPVTQTCRKGECVDATLPASCTSCGEGDLSISSAPACGDTGGLQPGAPWPMAGYCPTRTGRSGRLGPQTANVRWRFATGGIASMSPAVSANGTIFIGSNDRQIHAVSPDGKEIWHAALPSNINDTGFVIGRDGTVVVGCADGKMYAFTPDGKPKWATSIESDVRWTPAAGGDGTLFITGNGDPTPVPLFAVGPDGAVKWRNAGRFGVSAAAIGLDGTLYLGGADSALHALRRADGTEIWSAPTSTVPVSPAVGSDGTVYVNDATNVYAFEPKTGARRWSVPIKDAASGVALGLEDTVYVAEHGGRLLAVRANGTTKWVFDSGTRWAQPATIGGDGTAYLGGVDGALHAVSADGVLRWKVVTGGRVNSQPALGADGTLYVVSSDSFLYAIGP